LQELRNFKLEITVDPKFHPKIIGRRGAVVTKIRQDHDVHVLFPDKTSERPDLIVITGLEEKALAAKENILRIVQELVMFTLSVLLVSVNISLALIEEN